MTELKTRLKRLIVEALRLEGVDPGQIRDDAPLFGGEPLNLDSVDAPRVYRWSWGAATSVGNTVFSGFVRSETR